MKRCCSVLCEYPCLWEWCTPHELSTAINASLKAVNAGLLGLKNLLRSMRAIIEFLNRSEAGQNVLDEILRESKHTHTRSKLAQTIEQRWASLVKSIRSFCEKFFEIRQSYHSSGKNFEFQDYQYVELVEVYSIFLPIKKMITFCQGRKGFLIPFVVMNYLLLLNETLDVEVPLELN